jgi:hypothetical protein
MGKNDLFIMTETWAKANSSSSQNFTSATALWAAAMMTIAEIAAIALNRRNRNRLSDFGDEVFGRD